MTAENVFEGLLLAVLNRLDSVGAQHPELRDTAMRECMATLMHQGFVLQEEGFVVPRSLGMYTRRGDQRLARTLRDFFERARSWARQQPELQSSADRLDLLKSLVNVPSEAGNDLENYFGDPCQYPQ